MASKAEDLPTLVRRITFIGSSLHAMAYGTAIEAHLQTIEHLLVQARDEAKEREKRKRKQGVEMLNWKDLLHAYFPRLDPTKPSMGKTFSIKEVIPE
jgi:CO/xanthine dehydrogenase Mo-binding subunit